MHKSFFSHGMSCLERCKLTNVKKSCSKGGQKLTKNFKLT
jgi:hypothetical protein